MTYTETPTVGGTMGLIATITTIAVAVINVVKNIIDSIRQRRQQQSPPQPAIPCNGNVVDMTYCDNTGRWAYRMPITNVNPMYINGGNRMFEYDVFQGSDYYDTPNTNMYNRNLPYGYGYNPNKPDYIWQDKTLGQVPSTTEYVPFEARTGFDPVPWLKASNSYVNTMDPYYPYRSTNQFIKYDGVDPPKDDSYLKDPTAGMLFKDLKNHFQRRDFNPYEPSRPFATYNPYSINANDPAANPYNMTQEQINGMVNRSNYYKDYILNITKGNTFGAPNDIDNPFNLLGGPSYVGPDGKLHIRQVPPQPEYHARREFLASGRTKPYPTVGGEVFGRSMYHGFDFQTMNRPDLGYNRVLTGGTEDMYESRRYTDPVAPALMSIPFVQSYIRKQQADQARQKMGNPDPYASSFAQPVQKPILQSPYAFANPYARSIQNQIDRSQLMIDPKMGMDFNDGDPNDRLAMLMNIQPANMTMTPQQELQNQMMMNALYNGTNPNQMNPYNTGSILGNTHAGMLRGGMQHVNMNYGRPMNQMNPMNANAMYGMNPNMVYGMNNMNNANAAYGMPQNQMNMMRNNMNGGSLFTEESNIRSMMNYGKPANQMSNADAMYGMNPNMVNQMQNQQQNQNAMNSQQQMNTSISDVFGDTANDNSSKVMGNPNAVAPADRGLSQEEILINMMKMQNGEIPTDDIPEIREPEKPKSPDELASKLFDLYG